MPQPSSSTSTSRIYQPESIPLAPSKNNLTPLHRLLPLVLFITVLGISACFGMQTGARASLLAPLYAPLRLGGLRIYRLRDQSRLRSRPAASKSHGGIWRTWYTHALPSSLTPMLIFTFSIVIPESILALVQHPKHYVPKSPLPQSDPYSHRLPSSSILDRCTSRRPHLRHIFLGKDSINNTPNTVAKAHFEVTGRVEGCAAGKGVEADAV